MNSYWWGAVASPSDGGGRVYNEVYDPAHDDYLPLVQWRPTAQQPVPMAVANAADEVERACRNVRAGKGVDVDLDALGPLLVTLWGYIQARQIQRDREVASGD